MEKFVSTREAIRTLQEYEKSNGIGIIMGFSDKTATEPCYTIKIANKSEYGLIDNPKYRPKEIPIPSCKISTIFV